MKYYIAMFVYAISFTVDYFKVWFKNRRAKFRKRSKQSTPHQQSTSHPPTETVTQCETEDFHVPPGDDINIEVVDVTEKTISDEECVQEDARIQCPQQGNLAIGCFFEFNAYNHFILSEKSQSC